MEFFATKARVFNRGQPPDSFLDQLIRWGMREKSEVFDPNPNPDDIYALIKPVLGPWSSLLHRRAAMLEVMRVHAGFESSWNWDEGVDVTNQNSLENIEGQETGIFQVSFDSTYIDHGAMKPFAVENGIGTAGSFIPAMKSNHLLAMQYYARLVRVSIAWAGPLKRGEVNEWLSRSSMKEFQSLLAG
jgi:hypothetical protein